MKRNLSILILLFLFITHTYSFELNKEINIIFDISLSKNIDDIVAHTATPGDYNFLMTPNQTSASLEGVYNENFSGVLEFDFMGEYGFEIVSAYIHYKKNGFSLIVGKTENFVSTTEETLDYDGYYSTGGIQTGAVANQRQIKAVIEKNKIFFGLALTDELPTAEHPDVEGFYMKFPAVEGAIGYKGDTLSTKFAFHFAKVFLRDSNYYFYPKIIMNETEINFGGFTLKLSGFKGEAGSQFFVVDEMVDFFIKDGEIKETLHYGGYSQLIYQKKSVEYFIGVGGFYMDDKSVELAKDYPYELIKSNERFSIGFIKEILSEKIFVGFEYSYFRIKRIEGPIEDNIDGYNLQLQFKAVL